MKKKIITLQSNDVIPKLSILQSDKTQVKTPKFISKNGSVVSHDVHDGGSFTDENDQSISFSLKWDANYIHLNVKVREDTHHVHGQSDWSGDAVQLMFTDELQSNVLLELSMSLYGKNAEYNLDSLIHHMVRWQKNRYYKNGTVLLIQKSQNKNNDSLINFVKIGRDEAKKETNYKVKIHYNFLQTTPFRNDQSFGFGLMVNDGDYIDDNNDDGIEIAHILNNNSIQQVVKSEKILNQQPLCIALRIENVIGSVLILKRGLFEVKANNGNLFINNMIIKANTSKNFLLVININSTSNAYYCPINDQLTDVKDEDISQFDITKDFNIESFFTNNTTTDITLGEKVSECKISNRIANNGIQASWNSHNEEINNVKGQRGWCGWYPSSLTYPQDPKKTGLVHLQYGREYNYILSGNVIIDDNTCNGDNHYKVTFSKNTSNVIKSQIWSENFSELNTEREMKYIDFKKWVRSSFMNPSVNYMPTAIMQLNNGKQFIFIINRATINRFGIVRFYVSNLNKNKKLNFKKNETGLMLNNTRFIITN